MISNHFIASCPENVPVKKFENRSIFDESFLLTFWATLYVGVSLWW